MPGLIIESPDISSRLPAAEPEEAFGTLAKTAGLYSGENLVNANFIREKEKRGIVRIGKIEFIETIEDSNTGPEE